MQGDQVDRSGHSSDEEMEKKYQHYSTIKKSLEVLMEQSKNLVKNMNGWSESNRKIGEQLNAFVTSAPLVESAIMEEYDPDGVQGNSESSHCVSSESGD